MKNLKSIFDRLGLNESNGLFITKDNAWKSALALPNRVQRLIEHQLKPDAFFVFDQKPLILFFDNPADVRKVHLSVWNFNESPVAIIAYDSEVEIFNGFDLNKKTGLLKSFGKSDKLNDFLYFELVTGKTWEQYEQELSYKNRVDYLLLQNIKAAREAIAPGLKNPKSKIANALLGKAIFVRYLIDRKVKLNFDGVSKEWPNKDFCNLLDNAQDIRRFFDYLEDAEQGFNGDLFRLTDDEYSQLSAYDYGVVKRLLSGEDLGRGQPSLFDFYDFSIIPIEFISNVYELFIGQDSQKKEGAYYTPLFLVDYILKETVERHLSEEPIASIPSDYNYCKVLDPACGSGIFLVETLRKIIERYKSDANIDVTSDAFKSAIKELAKANIYGIDKDESAVQVAVFSIYLTLLDYLEPREIENFKFPTLLNINFFNGDFFDLEAGYNIPLASEAFDFILGNPPWKGNGMDEVGKKYLADRKRKEKKYKKKYPIAINNNEIAEGFILRVSDFSTNSLTKIAFIIRSSSLYNLGYKDSFSAFRQYWLEEYFIDRVFELAPVRHEVFEKSNKPAIAPAAVVFYRYAFGENTDGSTIHHLSLKKSLFFSLFKIFTITRNDYKTVKQDRFKEFDWLWKVLVYGSYLDFNFIARLKEEYITIRQLLAKSTKFIQSTGLHSRSATLKERKNTDSIKGIPFLETNAVSSFSIDYNKTQNLQSDKIDIVKDTRIYRPPMLLIREGIDMDKLTAKCAISQQSVLFKDSITSIKALDKTDIDVLNNIAAILSSSLFSYYAVNTFASIGIERERVKNYNKYSLPYLDVNVDEHIQKIETAQEEIHSENNNTLVDEYKIHQMKSTIAAELNKIEHIIFKEINLNDIETSLITYSSEISRELILDNKHRASCAEPLLSATLHDYAMVFVNRFGRGLSDSSRKFIVEIWHSKQTIGMLFKVVPIDEYSGDIKWVNKQDDSSGIISFLIHLGSQEITDRLFVQKDIRGFEVKDDYFYIFKPNEKRLWHKAIAYLDANEFADAMLKAGRASL